MSGHDDPVDAVILAFLDHCEAGGESGGPVPDLAGLTDDERARATAYLHGLAIARGLDPAATRPSVEALLAQTPLAPLIEALTPAEGAEADLARLHAVLAEVDPRARVEIDGAGVVVSYLDVRARFVRVPGPVPTVSETVRAMVRRLFDDDPDTSRIGVVAAHSPDLTTQLVAADDLAGSLTTPRGEPHLRWDPPLPLALAARRMLEQVAPEWPAFDATGVGAGRRDGVAALDVTGLAAEIARRVIARESGRSYRGDKRRAYQALLGREDLFADLAGRIAEPGSTVDLDAETTRITRAAA